MKGPKAKQIPFSGPNISKKQVENDGSKLTVWSGWSGHALGLHREQVALTTSPEGSGGNSNPRSIKRRQRSEATCLPSRPSPFSAAGRSLELHYLWFNCENKKRKIQSTTVLPF